MKNQFLLYEQTKYIFLNPTLSESSDSILEFFNFSVADLTKFPYGETWPSFSLIFFSKIKYLWKLFFKKRIQFLFVDPKSDWLLCALYVQEVFWICNALFESSRVFFWVKLSGKIQTLDLHSLKDMNYIFTLTKNEIFTKFYVIIYKKFLTWSFLAKPKSTSLT